MGAGCPITDHRSLAVAVAGHRQRAAQPAFKSAIARSGRNTSPCAGTAPHASENGGRCAMRESPK
ncbi:hypothetical protein D8B31_01755 [Verminephrobacter eiseniae]|nr:hypothetical protein [Verminephrobacter eiseniae]MCW5293682.1 hypothetical protein [Verminephrobacter eiseniae]MCW8183473.1 hypothetical protein [Verminephrobacter eiseniae]MCW8224718.1 hypothetical protein [Verminephrobacter eiseniae]